MPRGQARSLGEAVKLSMAREQKALDLAVLLATLQEENDPRLATGVGRYNIAREAGLSQGEFRRRLSDARKLLAAEENEEARAVFSFGPRTVVVSGARYRTRKVKVVDVRPGRVYAVIQNGQVAGTFAGDAVEAAAPGSGMYWRRVRGLISQGFSSGDAISMAASEAQEADYIADVTQQEDVEIVELIGSNYPDEIEEDYADYLQSDFVD